MTQRQRYFLWWSLLVLACLALFLSLRTDVLGSSTAAGQEGAAADFFTDSSGPESGNGNFLGSSGSSNSDVPTEASLGYAVTLAGGQTNEAPTCPNSAICQGSIGGGNLPYRTIPQSGGSGPSGGGGGQAPHGEGSFAHNNLLGFFSGWGGSSGSFGGGFGNPHAGDKPGTPGTNPAGDSPSNSGGSPPGTPGTNPPGGSPSDLGPRVNPLGSPLSDPIAPEPPIFVPIDLPTPPLPTYPPDGLPPPILIPIDSPSFPPNDPPPPPPTIPISIPLPDPNDPPPAINPPDGLPPPDPGNPDLPGGGPNDPPGVIPPPGVTNAVPEPGSLAIFAAGFAALSMIRRRKTRGDPRQAGQVHG